MPVQCREMASVYETIHCGVYDQQRLSVRHNVRSNYPPFAR